MLGRLFKLYLRTDKENHRGRDGSFTVGSIPQIHPPDQELRLADYPLPRPVGADRHEVMARRRSFERGAGAGSPRPRDGNGALVVDDLRRSTARDSEVHLDPTANGSGHFENV